MKKLTVSLLLGLLATACQPQATSAPATARVLPAVALPDSTAAVLQLLRQVDLAAAWANKTPATKQYPPLEGFYGDNHYRRSFYFDRVWRDSRQPNQFHFEGRDRYKKAITPFAGTLTVTRLLPLADTVALMDRLTTQAYSALADFTLREDSTASGAGWCRGRAALDFQLDQRQRVEQASFEGMDVGLDNPTKGCGLLFRGSWRSYRAGQPQPVVWANDFVAVVPEAFRKLGLGERGAEVSPKLAKYGWNAVMENDEWWADSPRPRLSL